jgi:hypothetical protein
MFKRKFQNFQYAVQRFVVHGNMISIKVGAPGRQFYCSSVSPNGLRNCRQTTMYPCQPPLFENDTLQREFPICWSTAP